ncbi:hypothetical protein EON64_05785 [archaeon]|nr:MAG: hypothetical protein EON64_05785 [archaeon]
MWDKTQGSGEWEDWENIAHMNENYDDDDQLYVDALVGLSAGFLSEMSKIPVSEFVVLQTSNNIAAEQATVESSKQRKKDEQNALVEELKPEFPSIPRQCADQDWSNWSEEPPYFDDEAEGFLDETPSSLLHSYNTERQQRKTLPSSPSLLTSIQAGSFKDSQETVDHVQTQVGDLQQQVRQMERQLVKLKQQLGQVRSSRSRQYGAELSL